MIDAFAPQEQDCIHDATDGGTLVRLSYLAVMSDSDLVDEWLPSLLYCLTPDTARALLLSSMLIFLEPELTESGIPRTEDHELCLREAVSDVDVGKIWIAEDDEAEEEVFSRIVTCFPELLAASIVESLEMEVELSEEERGCVQEWSESFDWEAVGKSQGGDDAAFLAALPGLVDCSPDLVLNLVLEESGIGLMLSDIRDGELGCLREWVTALDWAAVGASQGYDGAAFMAVLPGLADCSPDLVLNLVLEESGTGLTLSHMSDGELGCLREWVIALDWAGIPAGAEEGMAALASADNLLLCVPLVDLPAPEPSPIHTNESLIWQFPTEGGGVSAPAVLDGVVYFGSVDHHVYALDAVAGDLLWSFETGDGIGSAPTVTDAAVYVGSDDKHVYALDRETGNPCGSTIPVNGSNTLPE